MSDLHREIKELIIEALGLEDISVDDIGDEQTLFGEGLGLDSVDALELGLAIQKKYGIKIDADAKDTRNHFTNVASLAAFVTAKQAALDRTMQTRDDIFNTLRDALVELFELEPERISLGSNLYQDLEIDSIDAVDLIDHIKRQTGKKIAAEEFKSVRTVSDVVEAVYRLVQPAA